MQNKVKLQNDNIIYNLLTKLVGIGSFISGAHIAYDAFKGVSIVYDGFKLEVFDSTILGHYFETGLQSDSIRIIELIVGGSLMGIGLGILFPPQTFENENLIIGDSMQFSDDLIF